MILYRKMDHGLLRVVKFWFLPNTFKAWKPYWYKCNKSYLFILEGQWFGFWFTFHWEK